MFIVKFNNSIGNSCVIVIAQDKTKAVSATGVYLSAEPLNLI